MEEEDCTGETRFLSRRRSTVSQSLKVKDERTATVKKVATILQKPEGSRTSEECEFLISCSDIVKEVNLRQQKRDRVKARLEEVEDAPEILEEKCIRLAAAISRATSLAVYTGAGISTAASIPDYRGTNGVWTRMQQGKDIGNHDLSQAEPTITHMALYALYKARMLKHIVSQNCDGLHLRSGIPRPLLSEVHGNMYVEVCRTCKPSREYWRLFDVTEKTARYAHATGRMCHKCNSPLQDSIVHFGERGNLLWPINWNGASRAAKQADVILCLGSSLKVLKKYPWLWQMDRPVAKRPQLYIVNLQWTPKDENAVLKINGKCDKVMKIVMSHLGIDIPCYQRTKDPIFYHAIKLQSNELWTTSQPCLLESSPKTLNCNDQDERQNVVKIKEEKIDSDVEIIQEIPKCSLNLTERRSVLLPDDDDDDDELLLTTSSSTEKEEEDDEKDCDSQIAMPEPISAYPAPFFAALPFLSMGLPFPPMYIYPQLTPFLYYHPFVQMPAAAATTTGDGGVASSQEEDGRRPPKPKPACDFCMANESSLTCLYYQQRDVDGDSVTTDLLLPASELPTSSPPPPPPPPSDPSETQDGSAESPKTPPTAAAVVSDENAPAASSAKNPGWFGKGYRKGMKRKR